jgi:NRPS condensation-like uncharacterized protein
MVDNEELDALFDALTGTEDATKANKGPTPKTTDTPKEAEASKDNAKNNMAAKPTSKSTVNLENRKERDTSDKQNRVGKRRGRPRQQKETEEVHLCTIVDKELLRKIRTIATREGLQIKDVIGAAFMKAVKSYERKHGPIEGDGKTRIRDLF